MENLEEMRDCHIVRYGIMASACENVFYWSNSHGIRPIDVSE